MSAAKGKSEGVDKLTLIALGIIVFTITNISHEAGGHGGACVIVGGAPLELNAIYFDCDESGLSPAAMKWISAAGTLVNLAFGALAWLGLRVTGRDTTPGRYFLWLLMTVSLFQGTGYWMFSGIGNIGDWAKIIEGLHPAWLFRVLLAAVGTAGYLLTVHVALRSISPFLGNGEDRVARARTLMLVPYLSGGLLYVAAGLLNPLSPLLVLISAAAASFGGTSGLAWMHNFLRNPKSYVSGEAKPFVLPRSPALLAGAAVIALVFVVVLGRSIRF